MEGEDGQDGINDALEEFDDDEDQFMVLEEMDADDDFNLLLHPVDDSVKAENNCAAREFI